MIKTTLTKLKKAYSTLSFAPRALGVETNRKFYKLIVSILRRADKRTKPDKTEEEENERGEVLAKLMLAPSDTAALFSKGLSKPEAYQKSSFLAPPVDNKQREKSTFSKKEDSQKNDLNNPQCDLQEVAESMPNPVPHSMIKTETQVNKALESGTETYKQETFFVETKNIDPPNSLKNAIPDITLDKNKINDFPDEKSSDPKILRSPLKENNNIRPAKVNNIFKNEQSSYIHSRLYDKDDDSLSIKFFASYDKTKKPPSTETNSTFDELAKHCLDSPNNKIDERLLKEMKKLGIPQTGLRSENSVIEGDIIQMDVLKKPRKPAEKTEIDVETRKLEHPPLNYSDEQRLEFEPSNAEEKELLEAIQNNKKDILTPQLCNIRSPITEDDKPLLNPFDKRNINCDDDGKNDCKDAENYYHTNDPGAVQLEKTNEPLKSFHIKSQNDSQNTKKPLEIHKLSENEAYKENNPSNPPILSTVSVNNTNSKNLTKSNAVDLQPKSEQDSTKQSVGIADKVTISVTPLKNQNTVDYQPKGELDFSKQSTKNAYNATVNNNPVSQDRVDFNVADEPHVLSKLSEDKVNMTTINTTPLENPCNVDFQAEGELTYSKQFEETQKVVNEEPDKRPELKNMFCDHVPKIPEPLMVFNPPDQRSAKLSDHGNQIDFPRANEDLGKDNNVTLVQNLKSLRIRCNVLPTKNTDEKSTISLLVEIDAIKQPIVEMAARHQPDVTYREDFAYQQQHGNRSTTYLKKMDHITRDKITLILPAKKERTNGAQADSLPEEDAQADSLSKEKPEIPLSEMLKRVRLRNRAEYCHQLEKTLEHEWDTVVETVTGKCGDKKRSCPPRCPPPQKSRCPRPTPPPCGRPACPRPCRPAGPPACPPPCPRPCGPSRRSGGNPCCPGSGSSKRKGGNPCCPGSSSSSKGKGNPCCPGSSSSSGRRCKFSMYLPIMMNSFVSHIYHVAIAESELARNNFFMVTKDAYQRILCCGFYAQKYSPHLLPILSISGFDYSLGNFENTNSMLARDYRPWVPIPCWPEPKKAAKKPLPCPKGCQIPLPGKLRPPCNPYPCQGFPKRKNSFSIVDLYSCWSNPNGRQ